MKKIILLAPVTFLLFSCNENPTASNHLQYDSLVNVINDRDEEITNFAISFNDVERNLDSITIKQHIIALNSAKSGEFTQSQKTRINNEIKAINFLMNTNLMKLNEVTKKFKTSSTKNKALQATIITITNQLAQKQQELVTLNISLATLNAQVEELITSVDYLESENGIQADIIDFSISTLHTAYYVIGKSKALLDAKIIDKKGGLLGVGRTTEISAEIDNSNFTKIDFTTKTSFPINSKGVKIITSHPSKAYFLETDSNDNDRVINLVITDPPLFWSVSKYLVVQTK
jgi:hypothetical protein